MWISGIGKLRPLILCILLLTFILPVYGSPDIEDFTTYTEVDIPADRIQVTTDHVDHNSQSDETTYLYRDYEPTHFTNFTHTVDFRSAYGSTYGCGMVYALTNQLGSLKDLMDNSDTAIIIMLYRSATQNQIRLCEVYNGAYWDRIDFYPSAVPNKWYFVKIIKNGTSLICGIYSTSGLRDVGDGTDGDIDNLAITLQGEWSYRYAYACMTYNYAQPFEIENDIENLDLHEAITLGTWRALAILMVILFLFAFVIGLSAFRYRRK